MMARLTRRGLAIASAAALVLAAATTLVAQTPPAGATRARTGANAPRPLGPHEPARFGIGRPATPEEIARLDIDVMPNGHGLPEGRGTVAEGAAIYAAKCASCHGKNGEGANFDRLVATDAGANFDFGKNPQLARAIGNYWPYASTLYDYTARSMPFAQPGTLTPNEVYGVVAYLLHLNQLVPADAVMDKTTLPKVAMPARSRFVPDNRTGGKVVK
jgi:S-disulfanyl-L-cysteine oxidoreductase SoxD